MIATGSSNGGGAVLYAAERDAATGAHRSTASLRANRKFSSSPTIGSLSRADRSNGAARAYAARLLHLRQSLSALRSARCARHSAPRPDRLRPQPLRLAARQGAARRRYARGTGEGIARPHARLRLGRRHRRRHAFGYFVAPDATATKYANDHGRFDVRDRLCGYSYAAVDKDGRLIPVPPAELAQNFAIAPGGAPAGSIDVINDDDPTGRAGAGSPSRRAPAVRTTTSTARCACVG